MRSVAILLIAATLIAAPASAQEAGIWTDPSGRFTLAFPQLGWRETAASPRQSENGPVFEIEYADNPDLTCLIGADDRPVPATQARINELMGRIPVDALGVPAENVRSLEHVTLDGVTMAAYETQGRTFDHSRLFYLSDGSEARQTLIVCAAPDDSSRDTLSALLNTLHFLPRANP